MILAHMVDDPDGAATPVQLSDLWSRKWVIGLDGVGLARYRQILEATLNNETLPPISVYHGIGTVRLADVSVRFASDI